METKANTEPDGSEFERFKEFARKLVSVPKDEIKKKEAAEKRKKPPSQKQ